MREKAEITDRLLFAVGIIVQRLRRRSRKVDGQRALELTAVHLAMLDPEAIVAIERLDSLRAGPQRDDFSVAYKAISTAIVAAAAEMV